VERVLQEAADYDLTILGVGEEWGLDPHVFGLRSERIATHCPSSLLIVRTRAQTVPLISSPDHNRHQAAETVATLESAESQTDRYSR
jgi:hypothetical protein